MNVDEIVFDTYVICPLCKKEMKELHGAHLQRIHGYSGVKEFKIEFGIPLGVALISHKTRAIMQNKGKLRAGWFIENVMPIGIEYAKHANPIPEDSKKHSGMIRRGKSWIPAFISEMKKNEWLDLRETAVLLGISYNYARKCATDGRIKTSMHKDIRFTKLEWVTDARKLLQENREKYHKTLE